MQFQIRTQHLALDSSVQDYIYRKFDFSFDRFHQVLASLTIRLKDLNGPRGGLDKECQITASLPHSRTLVIVDQDSDLYSAIDRAVDRFRCSMVKLLKRYKSLRKQNKFTKKWFIKTKKK